MNNLSGQNFQKEKEDIYSSVLYVADLPNETTNEDLQKLFQDYHFQFASLNNFKNNMTWAQVYLENKEWANRARHELNGTILKPINCSNFIKGKPIRICKYEGKGPNRQTNIKQSLLIKNIDINMTQKDFYQMFLKYGDIVSGKIEYDENGISKGFGYIYYYTEESAEEAKKNLNGKSFFGKPLEIVNLIPGKKNKGNNITLFVLNIPNDINEENLTQIFGQFGPVSNISINHRGFAYVSYNNFDSASKCLNQMKMNPISFPGLPNVVVKYASTKEERQSNKNFINNNIDGNDIFHSNLNIQFNYLYINPEIKNDLDLDKEIRLFIKVVMLMDYSPKEVLVDFDSMSGLVIFDNFHDYNLFFKKYQDFCSKQIPPFECLPYQMPITNNESQANFYDQQNYNNKNPINFPGNNQMSFNHSQSMNNNIRNNNFPNRNMGINQNVFNNMNNNKMPMNNGFNYINNQRNNRFMGNKNNYYKNNNNEQFINNKNNKLNNVNLNNNNNGNILQRPNLPNNNQKFFFRQNNFNPYYINMYPNMPPINPLFQQQMMAMNKSNNPYFNNNRFNNNMRKQFNPNPNFMNLEQNNNNFHTNNLINNLRNDLNDVQKNDTEYIDQRNLQNLNPSQLLSQFNKPPINVYSPNMLNSKEQEDLINEIADSIYEIVFTKYPEEASKITGMIREKGYEKMNMLLSKKEDLNEIIDKAYDMIKKNKNNKSEIIDNK